MTTLYKIENVPILKTGIWAGSTGKAEFTEQDLSALEIQFNALKADNPDYALPLKLGHTQDDMEPAVGWFDNVKLIGNELYADLIDLPESVYKFINLKGFKNRSVEIGKRVDSATGEVIGRALKGMALLGAKLPAVNLRAVESGPDGLAKLGRALYGASFSEEESEIITFEEGDSMDGDKKDETIVNEKKEEMACGDNKKIKEMEEKLAEMESEKVKLSEQVKLYRDLQKKTEKESNENFVESLLKENKILPAQKDIVLEMFAQADNESEITIKLSEGEEKTTYKEMVQKFFESLKPLGFTSQSSQTEETLNYSEVVEKFSMEIYEKPYSELTAKETKAVLSSIKRNERYSSILPDGL
jgi:TolA-binding protein